MAYAAVISLLRTIDGLVQHPCRISQISSSTRECLESAYDHATSLGRTLECCSEGVGASDGRIVIEEARRLEDSIEFPLSQSEIGNLDQLRQDVDCFAQISKKMKVNIEESWEQKVAEMIEEYVEELFVQKTEGEVSSATDHDCDYDMVGISDQFLQIRDSLIAAENAESPAFLYKSVVWISGMAGIGKTTFAKKLFHDPSVKVKFECFAFVRVGQEFRREEVLDAITAHLSLEGVEDQEMIMEGRLNFTQRFCRILSLRKSLIVLADVWNDMPFLGKSDLGDEQETCQKCSVFEFENEISE